MRRARARTPDGVVTGEYDDGGDSAAVRADGREYVLGEDARLLPPTPPATCYCVGRNYAATLDQMDYERPEEPDFFVKPPVSVHPPERPVPYPSFSEEVTYAGELAAVVGERCSDLDPADVPDVVRGYTVLNDLDALDQPGRTARKAFTGSAPLGPCLATDLDPRDLAMETRISGETRQSATTAQMLFDPYEVVAFLSGRFVLQPGDVVAFGSPANPGTVEPGDEMELFYEGVGTLRNAVGEPRTPDGRPWLP